MANNNTNGGGSFIEEGTQQINVQSLGLYTSVQDIENTVVKTTNGTAIASRTCDGGAGAQDQARADWPRYASGRRDDCR